MKEEYYAYATGKKDTHFGLQYNAYGVYTFRSKEKALEDVQKLRPFLNQSDLEAIVIDITPLVQTGIIPQEKLYFLD